MLDPTYFMVEQKDDTVIVLPQRTIAELDELAIRDEWDLLLAQHNASNLQHVVVDLGALDYFGSIRLELLVVLWKRLDNQNKKLALCNVSPLGLEILQTAKLDTIWSIAPGCQQAIEIVRN